MDYSKLTYNKNKDRGVMFFSASNYRDAEILLECDFNEILVSYFYIRRKTKAYIKNILPEIKERKGLFMTDSGAFSFIHGHETEAMYTPEYWIDYLEEYVQFVRDNCESIFCAANLDLDFYVGREVVDEWNEKYFKPLEYYTNIVYVSHTDPQGYYSDKDGTKRLREYCSRHKYVGIASGFPKGSDAKYVSIARQYGTRLHGFGWTSIPRLKQFPFFSVDSTTWLSGLRYGSTYLYDGKNFKTIEYKKKYRRKSRKLMCRDNGVDFEAMLQEERFNLTKFNLLGWRGARQEYIRACNVKLLNKPVASYELYV